MQSHDALEKKIDAAQGEARFFFTAIFHASAALPHCDVVVYKAKKQDWSRPAIRRRLAVNGRGADGCRAHARTLVNNKQSAFLFVYCL